MRYRLSRNREYTGVGARRSARAAQRLQYLADLLVQLRERVVAERDANREPAVHLLGDLGARAREPRDFAERAGVEEAEIDEGDARSGVRRGEMATSRMLTPCGADWGVSGAVDTAGFLSMKFGEFNGFSSGRGPIRRRRASTRRPPPDRPVSRTPKRLRDGLLTGVNCRSQATAWTTAGYRTGFSRARRALPRSPMARGAGCNRRLRSQRRSPHPGR